MSVKIAVLLSILSLQGCAGYGTSKYTVEPFMIDGKQTCCRILIENGKEIGSLQARFKKTGDNWDISLKEAGVKAFEGQAIGADMVKEIVPNVIDLIPLAP